MNKIIKRKKYYINIQFLRKTITINSKQTYALCNKIRKYKLTDG